MIRPSDVLGALFTVLKFVIRQLIRPSFDGSRNLHMSGLQDLHLKDIEREESYISL